MVCSFISSKKSSFKKNSFMKLTFSLSEFREIDTKLSSVRKLAQYDPLITVIRERFQVKIARHLTSLRTGKERYSSGRLEKLPYDDLKQVYLGIGKERAVVQLLLDMTSQPLSTRYILLLSEILIGTVSYREKEKYLVNVNGDRQVTTPSGRIHEEMEELVDWYNNSVKAGTEHPVARAAWLHYRLTVIHPFSDWNGRIARLMLNLALMRDGYLPVLISPDERLNYYETLKEADQGNAGPIIRFIALRELDTLDEFISSPDYLSILGKYELERKLQTIDKGEKCIVLTEDSATSNLLGILLHSSGFNMAETSMISYEGCSKIASANLFSVFVKEKMPGVKILVHRDRDYLTDAEVEEQRETFSRIDTHLFVTQGTDVESYFLNAGHIHYCHPEMKEEQVQELIRQAVREVFPKSVDYLWKKEFGRHKTEDHSHLSKAVEDLVRANLDRFTHGKTALRVLSHLVQDRTQKKVVIEKPSPFLKIAELNQLARLIWFQQDKSLSS